MKTPFEIAGLKVPPGELVFGEFPVGQWRGGLQAMSPIMVLNGMQDGPALWLDACIHGNEVLGIEVIRRVVREAVTADELHGTIVAVPVVNPFAFYTGHRGTPLVQDVMDITDVHGVFPGDADGTLNDRLAHRIFTEMVKCDYVINLHQNTAPATPFTGVATCTDPEVQRHSVAMAKAFGLPTTEMKVGGAATSPVAPSGWPTIATQAAGKPTFIVELPPTGYFHEPSIQIGVRGLINVLRHLDMIPGDVELLPDLPVPPGIYGRQMVISNSGGLVHFQKQAGEWINKGETLALIRNIYGDLLETVSTPADGYVRTLLFGPHNEAIYEGEIIASLLVVDPEAEYFASVAVAKSS